LIVPQHRTCIKREIEIENASQVKAVLRAHASIPQPKSVHSGAPISGTTTWRAARLEKIIRCLQIQHPGPEFHLPQ